jgi:hypothetical protein
MTDTLIHIAWLLFLVGIVVTILVFIVQASPIAEPFKGWCVWLIYAIAALVVLARLLPLLEHLA